VQAEGVAHGAHSSLEFLLMGISVGAGLLGILIAALMYFEPLAARLPSFLNPGALADRFKALYTLLYNKYFIDEIYDTIIVNPVIKLCQYCLAFDLSVIDGLVNGTGWLTRFTAWLSHKMDIYLVDGLFNSMATLVDSNSGFWRRLQTGYLQNYALIFALGLILILGGVLFLS
jgi:NADH-quinone oxidoreductase subunit L